MADTRFHRFAEKLQRREIKGFKLPVLSFPKSRNITPPYKLIVRAARNIVSRLRRK